MRMKRTAGAGGHILLCRRFSWFIGYRLVKKPINESTVFADLIFAAKT
jgi:hypothetical protein